MAAKAENQTKQLIAIISLALVVISSIVSFTIFSTRIDERSKDNEQTNTIQWKAIKAIDDKADDLKNRDGETRVNLRILMEAQGLTYQSSE